MLGKLGRAMIGALKIVSNNIMGEGKAAAIFKLTGVRKNAMNAEAREHVTAMEGAFSESMKIFFEIPESFSYVVKMYRTNRLMRLKI